MIFSVILIICALHETPCDFPHSISGLSTSFENTNNSQTPCLDFLKEQMPYIQTHMSEDQDGTVIVYRCKKQ